MSDLPRIKISMDEVKDPRLDEAIDREAATRRAFWQLPYRAVMIRRGQWLPPRGLGFVHRWGGHLTIAALMLVWVFRLVTST